MEQKIEQFKKAFPGSYLITPERSNVARYLRGIQFMNAGEEVLDVHKPGEGNMNLVLRVVTNQRQFILKQSRPWVEKYPAIPAPAERNRIEGAFYKKISGNSLLRGYSPDILWLDERSNISLMTDLGEGTDYMDLYRADQILEQDVVERLVQYLVELHKIDASGFPDNFSMRELNHEHIFRFPFIEDNGFDLDQIQPGLAELALKYKRNSNLTSTIFSLGQKYLAWGSVLVHGDYYPGCWLSTTRGLKIIDPEFCFPGFAEFDLGMMTGHLLLSAQPEHYLSLIMDLYRTEKIIHDKLVFQIGGISVLRRILGVAQLPLEYSLEEKEQLMDRATQWIV